MEKRLLNYETMLKVTQAITATRDPEEICLVTVESVKSALEVKGCALFLVNRRSEELELAAAFGLSQEYLNKGPVSAIKSIAATFRDGPVAISDVSDDPRIQYPEAAQKEGIASILSVPMVVHEDAIGALRIYTSEPMEFTIDDVTFVQAVAQLTALAIDSSRLRLGLKHSIEILKTMRDPKKMHGMAQSAPAPSPA